MLESQLDHYPDLENDTKWLAEFSAHKKHADFAGFISYNKKTRDHTERLLKHFGFDIDINDKIKVKRKNIIVMVGYNLRFSKSLSFFRKKRILFHQLDTFFFCFTNDTAHTRECNPHADKFRSLTGALEGGAPRGQGSASLGWDRAPLPL